MLDNKNWMIQGMIKRKTCGEKKKRLKLGDQKDG